jgi:glucose/arabinose dehydrogenase
MIQNSCPNTFQFNRRNRIGRTLVVLILTVIAPVSGWTAFDQEWTFNNNGISDYTLTSLSSTDVYRDPIPVNDPTINLFLGTRYRVTVVNFGAHPLQLLAKGATSGGDVILLAQGAAVGTFEGDAGVSWADLGGGVVEFTLTKDLVDAMRASSHIPGYRCGIHVSSMRGDFEVFGAGDPIPDPIPDILVGAIRVELDTVAEGLTAPLGVVDPDDGTGRLFVYEQAGTVTIIDNGVPLPSPFLDVTGRLVTLGFFGTFDEGDFDERGLLGFALHPDFTTNGKLYTYTSEPASGSADFTLTRSSGSHDHQSVIAEWTVDPGNANQALPGSRRELLRIDQPQFNHDGGDLHFGPDGFLYISLGDGGNADDEGEGHGVGGNGQNVDTVHGSILRIDVDGNNSANARYGIPPDNPFVGQAGVDEIFAYGFRNPYRFSFDRGGANDLFVGDVGQNDIEEIDVATSGGNYGWRHKEGSFFFDGRGEGTDGEVVSSPVAIPPPGPSIDPLAEYDHDDGIAVVGGFVYRGSDIPELGGRYVFGDFSTGFGVAAGRIFYLDDSNNVLELQLGQDGSAFDYYVKGFGQDSTGEIYICVSEALGPFGTGGKVLKLASERSSSVDNWLRY